jgi:Rieske Fe-S protein
MTDRDTTTERPPAELNRRVVLLGAGAVGVAGVLAACGGGEDDPEAGPGTTSADRPPSTPAETPAETPPTAGSGGTPLATTSEVPVGGGVIVSSEEVVVTQPTEGEFKAFTSICTHQGCEVSRVEDGVIACLCHGSRYSAADGSVQEGPAPSPLDEIAVTVEGDQILLS